MSRIVRKQLMQTIALLQESTEYVKTLFKTNRVEEILPLLTDAQDLSIALGQKLERLRGNETKVVPSLERYCEALYQLGECLVKQETFESTYTCLQEAMSDIVLSFEEDYPDKKEIVFFPYKASMWDSLESIWRAADEDPLCEAYVVPIPYFDRNPDGSVKETHYEGDLFPKDVPIVHYEDYDLEERCPDVAYIHNPYDEYNAVTSVDPVYYSRNIKKYSSILVYVPYFATAGGMADSQALCPAYVYADYIVVQSEKYIDFYDKSIPREKFLPYGSPKFDKVIRLCENPPEAPMEWKEQMAGKKVYFYNTSLGGMLGDTEAFLKKMEYVFDTFEGRTDACLLWRPHPLLENTFKSMRESYYPWFLLLKKRFLEERIGIYDDTPSIEETIALSDVYIGDAGTSVTSLFGVVGKPMFLLDNNIHRLPTEQDKKDSICPGPQFDRYENEKYQVTGNNQLWVSEKRDHRYRFYMDLDSKHSGGGYYKAAIEINDKIYVLPANAQHMLVIQDKQIIERIEFKDKIVQAGVFNGLYYNEDYIFLFPFRYPALVRYDLRSGQLAYVEGVGEFRSAFVDGEWYVGGILLYGEEFIVASPTDKKLLFIHMDTLETRQEVLQTKDACGTQGIVSYGDELWLLPLNGMTVTCWNPKTKAVREYNRLPENFICRHFPQEYPCKERPFGVVLVDRNGEKTKTVLTPFWGNMFVELDVQTGEMKEWKPQKELLYRCRDSYHISASVGGAICPYPPRMDGVYRFWYASERSLWEMDIRTGEMKKLTMEFDLGDAEKKVPGFSTDSEWLQYGCIENAFNSLKDLLDDEITGGQFDKEATLRAYQEVNASVHGECGERVHAFICNLPEEEIG